MTDARSRPSAPNRAPDASEPDTYLKACRRCDQLIRMVGGDDGTWRSLEPTAAPASASAGAGHDCDTMPEIRQDWSLQELGHPLTCRLDCWWCGDDVFLHTDGTGAVALFDALGWPWPAHRCWHERAEEQERALLKLESDLRARGYQGRGRLIGVAPSAMPSAVPTRGRKDPPALQIRLSGTDHQIVDGAVEQIIRFVSAHHHRTPVAVPLPVGKNVEAGGEGDGTEEPPFAQHIHHRAIEVWEAGPDLVARLAQVQLPEAVEVSIRQAKNR